MTEFKAIRDMLSGTKTTPLGSERPLNGSDGLEPDFPVECAGCGGAGWVSLGLRRMSDTEMRQDFTVCRLCRPERPGGIPPERADQTFATFDLLRNPEMRRAHDRCWAVAHNREWCAVLSGGYGTGKTHLAIAALNEMGRGRFWKVPDLLDWLRREGYGERGIGIDAALSALREMPVLLVLDDLGAEKTTEWAAEQLYRILDARYEARRPTIITSNHPWSQMDGRLKSRYGKGLILCVGTDQRLLAGG